MIELEYENQTLAINRLGGGLAEYYLNLGDKRREIVYGYKSEEEKTGSMGDVLFPFPGRVEGAKYQFGGEKYELTGLRIKDGHANHGFAKWEKWKLISKSRSRAALEFRMEADEYGKKGFPFFLVLKLIYELKSGGLVCTAKVENLGKTPTPFGLGFHPYLALGGGIDQVYLKIGAAKVLEQDRIMKPTGKLLALAGSGYDFLNFKKIGRTMFDNCFTDLNFENGIAKTALKKGDEEIIVWQDENFPYLQIFSADTLPLPHRRRALAVEPQTCSGFAFNVAKTGRRTLAPGEKFQANWGINF